MRIFKSDITGCFNQLYRDQHRTPLMGFTLDEDTLMLMLTCGFGVGVTPRIWSEVGDAMNRTANLRTLLDQDIHLTQDHVCKVATVAIRGVLGPTGLSERKTCMPG